MSDLDCRILRTLEHKPLSTEELATQLGADVSTHSLDEALYRLREQKSWIVKHPVFGGGCKTCACSVTYLWRLTLTGRQALNQNPVAESAG